MINIILGVVWVVSSWEQDIIDTQRFSHTAPSWHHGISLLLWLHENLAQPSLQDVLQSSNHHLRLHSLPLLSQRCDLFPCIPCSLKPVLNILNNSSAVAQVFRMVSSISSQPRKMFLKSVKKCAKIKSSKKSASPGRHRLRSCWTKWRQVLWRSLFLLPSFFISFFSCLSNLGLVFFWCLECLWKLVATLLSLFLPTPTSMRPSRVRNRGT